jgi:hypothetical protein
VVILRGWGGGQDCNAAGSIDGHDAVLFAKASAQAEERQDGEDDDDEADKINDPVHGNTFRRTLDCSSNVREPTLVADPARSGANFTPG